MAIIDLRNVTIVIQDGYEGGSYPFTPWLVNHPVVNMGFLVAAVANTGFAVNNSGGYTAGTTTITVGTGTGIIQTGATFTIAGETGSPVHKVTSHVETLGDTTSLTFTTAIATGGVTDTSALTIVPAFPPGATTMAIDTGTDTITTGSTFTVAGETGSPVHTVTSHTETLSATTSVTFAPAIASGGVLDEAALTVRAAYVIGATTLAVDSGTGSLVDGDTFTIAGETGLPVHTVTGHSETLANTTSITFSPATVTATLDDTVITVLPHSQTVHIGEGNMTYSEKRKIKYVTDRGILNTVKLEEDQPLEAKLAYEWDFLTSSISEGIPTTEDVFKFRNLCANWVSTSPDKCEIPCVDIVLYNTPPCNGVSAEQIILHMFRWEDLAHDPKAGTVDVTGKCNTLTALVSRIPT